ncbi:hypothetical protein Psed_0347 [Pseudonocardia dioxanivorans CB1190]|uniref:Alpha/beta hydrolase n=1 Tax=Pseudonocardia dioxanivorans (strain ATCC 55486 / DSM 44775 / JCM 13855 / CB1190) TaxID=675635 RepID=F4CS60_PSEUX|nr:hypothetical protein Psed_0347 [Pseudonocardia dioxanivorans CB1190]
MDLNFTEETLLDDGVRERGFLLGDIPGTLWSPGSERAPLVLLGHPGDLRRMHPRLAARARYAVARGFAAATIENPGSGDRPRTPALDDARADLRRAVQTGERVPDDVVDGLVLPLVDQAVPEWQALLDALPGIDGRVAYTGGIISIGVRLARVEPRIAAAVLFAGSWVPRAVVEEAREVTVPVHVLLQWDDEGNDRQQALDLFDALGSPEKSLHANMGGHTGVPEHAGEDADRFLERHLR